jgi:hypothetical protein
MRPYVCWRASLGEHGAVPRRHVDCAAPRSTYTVNAHAVSRNTDYGPKFECGAYRTSGGDDGVHRKRNARGHVRHHRLTGAACRGCAPWALSERRAANRRMLAAPWLCRSRDNPRYPRHLGGRLRGAAGRYTLPTLRVSERPRCGCRWRTAIGSVPTAARVTCEGTMLRR